MFGLVLESFCRILKFAEDNVFHCSIVWMVNEGEWDSLVLLLFLRCMSRCFSIDLARARCFPVLTTESGEPRFLKNWLISSAFSRKSSSS